MFYLVMSLFWKMIYHHSVLRDICNDFLFDFGQIVRYLKPKPNLQSNYELTKVKKYTWVVFLRILEQIWNPFNFKSFSLFHTRLWSSLEAFVLYNYITVLGELGHIGYWFYKRKIRVYHKILNDFPNEFRPFLSTSRLSSVE